MRRRWVGNAPVKPWIEGPVRLRFGKSFFERLHFAFDPGHAIVVDRPLAGLGAGLGEEFEVAVDVGLLEKSGALGETARLGPAPDLLGRLAELSDLRLGRAEEQPVLDNSHTLSPFVPYSRL